MYSGEKLGRAIHAAIVKKRVSNKEVAKHFKVTPASVTAWCQHGRISKDKIEELVMYFADTVPASHFGFSDLSLDASNKNTQNINIDEIANIGNRIKQARNRQNISQSQLARMLNISTQAVQQWESNSTLPRKGRLDEIAEALGISVDWLQFGDGEISNQTTQNAQDYITFEVLNISAKMGTGIINAEYLEIVDTVTVAHQWAKKILGNNLSSIKVITARGDSMADTIQDGSVLFVDESVNYYNGEGVYVIATPDGLKAKRLQMTLSGCLNIISDNSKYPIETIEKQEIETVYICGKVKGAWQLDMF